MKKRIFSIVLSAMLVGSLSIASVSADISSDGLGTALSDVNVDVTLGVKNPVYKIVVPTSYTFAVDPFEQMTPGSQIGSADYHVINKSNVNVTTDISFKLAKSSNTMADKKATYDASETKDTTYPNGYLSIASSPDTVETDKNAASLWIGAAAAYKVTTTKTADVNKLYTNSTTAVSGAVIYKNDADETDIRAYASGVTPNGFTKQASGTANGIAYDADGIVKYADITGISDAIYWQDTTNTEGKEGELGDLTEQSPNVVTIGTESQTMHLALAKANSIDYCAADDDNTVQATASATENGVTSFRFIGAANPNYKWADSLMKLTVSYNFNGIAASDYTALQYVGTASDGSNGKTGVSKMVKDSSTPGAVTYSLKKENGDAVTTINKALASTKLTINNLSATATITKVVVGDNTLTLTPTQHYTTSGNTITIAATGWLAATGVTSATKLVVTAGGVDYTISGLTFVNA